MRNQSPAAVLMKPSLSTVTWEEVRTLTFGAEYSSATYEESASEGLLDQYDPSGCTLAPNVYNLGLLDRALQALVQHSRISSGVLQQAHILRDAIDLDT